MDTDAGTTGPSTTPVAPSIDLTEKSNADLSAEQPIKATQASIETIDTGSTIKFEKNPSADDWAAFAIPS